MSYSLGVDIFVLTKITKARSLSNSSSTFLPLSLPFFLSLPLARQFQRVYVVTRTTHKPALFTFNYLSSINPFRYLTVAENVSYQNISKLH